MLSPQSINEEKRIITLNNLKIQAAKIATFFMILCSVSYIAFASPNIQPLPEPERPAKPSAVSVVEEYTTAVAETENKNVNAIRSVVEEAKDKIDMLFEEAEKLKEKIQSETGEFNEIKEEIKDGVKELSDKIKEKLEDIRN